MAKFNKVMRPVAFVSVVDWRLLFTLVAVTCAPIYDRAARISNRPGDRCAVRLPRHLPGTEQQHHLECQPPHHLPPHNTRHRGGRAQTNR
jgi:hypothetical protein